MSLDTRGFAQGFAQGFGLMDHHYNSQHRRQMEEEMMGLRQQQASQQQQAFQRQQQDWSREDDERSMLGIHAELQTTGGLDPQNLDQIERIAKRNPELLPPQLREWHQSQAQRTQGLADEARGITGQLQRSRTPQAQQNKPQQDSPQQSGGIVSRLNQDNATSLLEHLLQGQELTPDEQDALQDAPSGLFMMGTPEMDQALAAVDQQMQIISGGENIHVTPEFLEAVNTVYDNHIGEGKRIVGIYPGNQEGTVVFELEVDGEQSYRAPLTSRRGTEADEDNEVKQIPVEELIDSLQGARALHMAFQANPEAMQSIQRHGQMLGMLPAAAQQERWETVTDEHGRVTRVNTATGRAESVHGALPQGAGGSGRQSGSSMSLDSWAQQRAMLARGQDAMGNLIDPDQAQRQMEQIDQAYALAQFGVPEPQLLFVTQQIMTENPDLSVDEAKRLVLDRRNHRLQQQQEAEQEAEQLGSMLGLPAMISGSMQRQPQQSGLTARSILGSFRRNDGTYDALQSESRRHEPAQSQPPRQGQLGADPYYFLNQ